MTNDTNNMELSHSLDVSSFLQQDRIFSMKLVKFRRERERDDMGLRESERESSAKSELQGLGKIEGAYI